MKDQHEKIKGYRDLSQEEVDLMNEIKEHAQLTKNLLGKVKKLRKANDRGDTYGNTDTFLTNSQIVESRRCLDLAKDYLQTGQMWFVRAVALPESFNMGVFQESANLWVAIELETTREMSFKSSPNTTVILHNVTHYKKRDGNNAMLKCDEGIFYFKDDDVSWIKSKCSDWVV